MPASLVYVLCIMGRVWFMVECGRSVVWYCVVWCGVVWYVVADLWSGGAQVW